MSCRSRSSSDGGYVGGSSPATPGQTFARADRHDAALAAVGAAEDIGGSLGQHIDVGRDEESGYLGKRRGVDDAKPLGTAHTEVPVQHCHRVTVRSDRATARGM